MKLYIVQNQRPKKSKPQPQAYNRLYIFKWLFYILIGVLSSIIPFRFYKVDPLISTAIVMGFLILIFAFLFYLLDSKKYPTPVPHELKVLELGEECIFIGGEFIDLSDITALRFEWNLVYRHNYGYSNYLTINDDIHNKIHFRLPINESYKLQMLKDRLLKYYEVGVNITEFYGTTRCYLLNHNLYYEEIQELKRKYSLKCWY